MKRNDSKRKQKLLRQRNYRKKPKRNDSKRRQQMQRPRD